MLFNSLTFLAFFVVLLIAYYAIPGWTARKTLLLVASYVFYAAWNPPFVILLWVSTLVDWWAAGRLHRAERTGARRFWLGVSLVVNLGLLGFFKYGGFVLQNFSSAVAFYGVHYQAAAPDITLPVGISFYTFQTMSYTLDVYLRRSGPARSFLDFALYVTFFPQLVAGPIVRATEFLPQCRNAPVPSRRTFHWGLFLVTLGLFQKVVLADAILSGPAEAAFSFPGVLRPLDAWLGVLAFSGQIFFDFAGYSTCAIGVALCFGFSLPDNFRCPYAAIGFSDFWRRWHISLSTWLRDYLYIPLGGNRHGRVRTAVNLMVTMLLGGLWHGASWTFVVWGGLHGLYLSVERALRNRFGGAAWIGSPGGKILLGLVTYFLVNLTWVFFRAKDFDGAARMLLGMAGVAPDGGAVLAGLDIVLVTGVIAALLVVQWTHRSIRTEDAAARVPAWLHTVAWAGMIVLLVLTQGGGNAFIYFQF